MLKRNKILSAQQNKAYELFLGSTAPGMSIGKALTGKDGKEIILLPASLANAWNASTQHTFIVKVGEAELNSVYTISKSSIKLDTLTTEWYQDYNCHCYKTGKK